MRGESAPAATGSEVHWPGDLLDALPASVVIVELGSTRVLFANRAALELTGDEDPVAAGADSPLIGRSLFARPCRYARPSTSYSRR